MLKLSLAIMVLLHSSITLAQTISNDPSDESWQQSDQTETTSEDSSSPAESGALGQDETRQADPEQELVETVVSEPYFEEEAGWDDQQEELGEDTASYELPEGIELPDLPGKEIKYKLKLHTYNHHDLHGRADSDIGKLKFKSKLMPSNEVKMDIKLKGEEEILFKAYLDLANYTMELDGGGAILSVEQKTMMQYTAEHLRQRLIKKFQDEIPDHSFMTVQLLTYWSKSPEGFRHIKRDVVSN